MNERGIFMEKWKYISVNAKLITWKDSDHVSSSEQLDKLGEDGWEMVGIDGAYLYFKRKEKIEAKPIEPVDNEQYSLFTKKSQSKQ